MFQYSKYFGNYPVEYNRAIHGPYDPSRFYGRADTPLADVKLNQLFAWINRRNAHPVAIAQATSRAYYRFIRRFAQPKYASVSMFGFQFIALLSIAGYIANYPKSLSHHKQYKYHW